MNQTFHCSKCKTNWTPDNNDWAIQKITQCPFCNLKYRVTVSMKEGKLVGEILHAATSTK